MSPMYITGLTIFITLAAFVYIHVFDFASSPGGTPLIFIFRKLGTGAAN